MAFSTTETAVIRESGYQPAKTIIYGTYTSSGGGTGGVIAPGYTNVDGTFTASTLSGSAGCRFIVFPTLTTGTADAVTPISAVSYNTTLDRQVVTITTSANGTGFYMLECYDNGTTYS